MLSKTFYLLRSQQIEKAIALYDELYTMYPKIFQRVTRSMVFGIITNPDIDPTKINSEDIIEEVKLSKEEERLLHLKMRSPFFAKRGSLD